MSENFSDENQLDEHEGIELDENEEIEFDDNIDIDALQNQLKQHMEADDIIYNPEPVEEVSRDEFAMFESANAPVPVSEDGENILELDNFVKSVENDNEITGENDEVKEVEFENYTAQDNLVDDNEADSKNKKVSVMDEKPKLQIGEKKYIVYIEPDNIDFIEGLSLKERKKVINRVLRDENADIKKKKKVAERVKFINQVVIMVVTVIVALPIFFILLNKSIEITILNYQQSQQRFVKLYKEQGKIRAYKNFQNKF